MTTPRGLSASEAALWRRVAETVVPLAGQELPKVDLGPSPLPPAGGVGGGSVIPSAAPRPDSPTPSLSRKREEDLADRTLDASWDKRLARGLVSPDTETDLHGLGLDRAHDRLMASLAHARAMGARVVLVIAGKPRPHDAHDQRGNRRGAIRAKLLDWLASSPHASAIAAIRPAHQRHGGAGAVYVVLRRVR